MIYIQTVVLIAILVVLVLILRKMQPEEAQEELAPAATLPEPIPISEPPRQEPPAPVEVPAPPPQEDIRFPLNPMAAKAPPKAPFIGSSEAIRTAAEKIAAKKALIAARAEAARLAPVKVPLAEPAPVERPKIVGPVQPVDFSTARVWEICRLEDGEWVHDSWAREHTAAYRDAYNTPGIALRSYGELEEGVQ
jgi:hypothetical protein